MGRLTRPSHGYFPLMDEQSISTAQYRALTTLGRGPLALTVKKLAERISLSPPATSRMTGELVRRGWVTRVEDEADRRQERVRIGPAGADMLRRLDDARVVELGACLAQLDEEDGPTSSVLWGRSSGSAPPEPSRSDPRTAPTGGSAASNDRVAAATTP